MAKPKPTSPKTRDFKGTGMPDIKPPKTTGGSAEVYFRIWEGKDDYGAVLEKYYWNQ